MARRADGRVNSTDRTKRYTPDTFEDGSAVRRLAAQPQEAPKEEPEQEKKYRVRFFADGTKEQLGKLIAFMNENNIKYGKIAKESK